MKKYYNEELQEFLEENITSEKYGEYTQVLHEMIQRRAIEYGFPIDRMKKEVLSLVANLNSIRYTNEKKDLPSNCAAIYDAKTKEIVLNRELLQKSREYYIAMGLPPDVIKYKIGEELYMTLNHEVYHAITCIDEKHVGLEFDQYGIVGGRNLTEAVTEIAATRTTSSKNIADMKNGFSNTVGYSSTTFAISMIAYVMGVTQKELLSHSLGDYNEFVEFFSSKYPNKSEAEIKDNINLIDSVVTVAVNYSKPLDKENNEVNMKSSINGFKHMFDVLTNMGKNNFLTDKRPLDMEVIGEMFTRVKKMTSIINSSLALLKDIGVINEEGVQDIIKGDCVKNIVDMQKIVLGRYVAYQQGFKPSSIEYSCATAGYLDSLDKYYSPDEIKEIKGNFANKSYMEIEQDLLSKAMKSSEFFRYIQLVTKDDYTDSVIWDNSIYLDLNNEFEKSKDKDLNNKLKEDDDIR